MKKIIAAGGLVLNESAEILMIFRRGFWDLPKGKLDEGETIESCAIREVQEETGLKQVQLKKFIGITNHQYFDEYLQQQVNKETHWFLMQANNNQKLFPQTEEDIEQIKWVSKKELLQYLEKSYKNITNIIEKFYA